MRALALAVLLVGTTLAAQSRPAQPAAPAGPGSGPRQPAYVYSPEGRRDPFVSLVRRTETVRRPGARATDGVASFLLGEIALKGILRSQAQYVALLQGPDNKTYLVRVNDRLLDAVVRAITADTLILMQDVSDPLSLTKQREVRKVLRAPVDAK
jgi:Tfp pilus assembly protein PilP